MQNGISLGIFGGSSASGAAGGNIPNLTNGGAPGGAAGIPIGAPTPVSTPVAPNPSVVVAQTPIVAPVAPVRIVNKQAVTNIAGRQTLVPENGGTFFVNETFGPVVRKEELA